MAIVEWVFIMVCPDKSHRIRPQHHILIITGVPEPVELDHRMGVILHPPVQPHVLAGIHVWHIVTHGMPVCQVHPPPLVNPTQHNVSPVHPPTRGEPQPNISMSGNLKFECYSFFLWDPGEMDEPITIQDCVVRKTNMVTERGVCVCSR